MVIQWCSRNSKSNFARNLLANRRTNLTLIVRLGAKSDLLIELARRSLMDNEIVKIWTIHYNLFHMLIVLLNRFIQNQNWLTDEFLRYNQFSILPCNLMINMGIKVS